MEMWTTVLLLLAVKAVSSIEDQCLHYKILPRDNERSKNNTVLPTDVNQVPCDDVIDGWYRFATGEVATSCVPIKQCGTISTVWMKDPVPDIGQTRVNEFCVNHETATNLNPCCLFSLHVNVTNCDGYMVYYFEGSNFLCPAGYCRGDLKKCPVGQTSSTGFEPCNGVTYPVMSSPPTQQAPVIINNGHDFSQTCHINYNGSLSDVAFRVTWLFDGTPYKTVTLTTGVTSASLTSNDWKGNVGKKLSCSVDSYFISQGHSNHSQILTSNDYVGSLLVTPTSLDILEGDHGSVGIQSTLPIVCSNVSLDKCELRFDIKLQQGDPGRLLLEDTCSLAVAGNNWDPVTHKIEVRTNMSMVIDPMQNTKYLYRFSLNLHHTPFVPRLFESQGPFEVQVTTHDAPHHYCMVLGLAEFVGFKRTQAYHVGAHVGDFLVYKGANGDSKILQVQIRTWRPVGKASSVCAVAFQYGDTLIKVDMCTVDVNKTAPVITQGRRDPDDVQTYLCGSNYEIVTADGIRLSVLLNVRHLDLKLHIPPPFDTDTEGGCGFNKPWTYFGPDDVKLYGLSEQASLFDVAATSFNQYSSSINHPASYCQCGNPTCNPFLKSFDPTSPLFIDKTGKSVVKQGCSRIMPHALNPEIIPKEALDITGYAHQPHLAPTTYSTCLNTLKQHSNQYCNEKYRLKESFFTTVCTMDSRTDGDITESLPSAVQGFHWWCQEEGLGQPAYLNNGNILPNVTSDMCPSLCSLKGTCVHGMCHCDDGFEGVDCSVNKTAPPVILGIKGGDVCEMSTFHCFHPILITRNMYPGKDLQVVVEARDVLSPYHKSETVHMEPIYENKYSLSIPMTHLLTFLTLEDKTVINFTLKVSSDGKVFSPAFNYLVYDDKCQFCQVNGAENECLQKENSCRVDGRCYTTLEVNPVNPSQICDPDKAMLHWSDVKTTP